MSKSSKVKQSAIPVVLIAVLVVAGCAANSGGATNKAPSVTTPTGPSEFPKDGAGIVVGGASLWDSNPAIKALDDAVNAAVEVRGATSKIIQANPKDPISSVVSNLDTVLATKPSVAWFWPVDPDALTAPVKRANAGGIPVFSFEVTNAPVTSIVHQGREAAAAVAAQTVCKMLPKGGNILFGDYAYPDPNIINYKNNFTSALKDCSQGMVKIAAIFENKTDDVAGAIDPALAALQQVPDAKAIVNYSDVSAIGASRAADQLGMREKLKIIGLNLSTDGLAALQKGTIDYSFQTPPAEAQYSVNKMIDVALGKKVPKYATFWMTCYSTATADKVPTPAQTLVTIKAGKNLVTDPATQVATSDTALVTKPPADLPGCPSK